MTPAGMVAVSAPSVGALMVKRTVVWPGCATAAVTARPAMPLSCKSPTWTDAGSIGSLNVTSYVNGPGNVNTPPAAGFVAITCSVWVSYRNTPLNPATRSPAAALVNGPAAMLMVCAPCAVTGLELKLKTIVALPGTYSKFDAAIPLTVKSLAAKVAGSAGSEMFTVNVVG